MAFFDLSEEELRSYQPHVTEPEDFDEFWSLTLAQTRAYPLDLTLTPVTSGLSLVEIYDVEFAGYGGDRIKAWLVLPAGAQHASLPGLVSYVGYGGGRGLGQEHLFWANAGYANLVMDTRGQGSVWGAGGHTPDPTGYGPATPGSMTKGIEHPNDYYYRRVYADGVRAVEALRAVPQVDSARVGVTGVSQGGGISLAVGGLVPDLMAVMPDVPFLCNMRRATEITDSNPYYEITQYLATHRNATARVFDTLSYFDAVNFAKRATAPTLFSVALMDPICPPSTVFSAFNTYGSMTETPERSIEVYPYNRHEGGQFFQVLAQLNWLTDRLESSSSTQEHNV